ncbi:hypothetical protein FC16_GL001000 [Loigolactobacillus coryniformis subsp. torquens DSM 20004 = KCTC 3535]|nr:hypothetical protein FC16_GL001000 [Loigolactobacillus coryniformis subsp. torquens DSM 20004 = KCTC 3535]
MALGKVSSQQRYFLATLPDADSSIEFTFYFHLFLMIISLSVELKNVNYFFENISNGAMIIL